MYAITDAVTLTQCLSERDQLRRHLDSIVTVIASIESADLSADLDMAKADDFRDSLIWAVRDRENAIAAYENPPADYATYEANVAMGACAP